MTDNYIERILRARVYDVAHESPLEAAPRLSRRLGNQIMLKEHFRCVPAIIEFSNRVFYQGDIRPLRVPKANERLDPPLIDVFVKGGYRKGDVNPAEAKAIVDEIKSIIEDPAYESRSIGVVTLLGNAQAAHIHELVACVSPQRHRLAVLHGRLCPLDVVHHVPLCRHDIEPPIVVHVHEFHSPPRVIP